MGKVSTVLIAVCLAMAIISWSVRLWWISLLAIASIVALKNRLFKTFRHRSRIEIV